VLFAPYATAPLATKLPATPLLAYLNLKPNINDYSCTSLALLWWNLRATGKPADILIRTSAAPTAVFTPRRPSNAKRAAAVSACFSVFFSASRGRHWAFVYHPGCFLSLSPTHHFLREEIVAPLNARIERE
jgi:hypothetical protein